jgi:hypothetical protein
MLVVYVDDMIITDDDEDEIARLKMRLRKDLEVKDLGHLRYFLDSWAKEDCFVPTKVCARLA